MRRGGEVLPDRLQPLIVEPERPPQLALWRRDRQLAGIENLGQHAYGRGRWTIPVFAYRGDDGGQPGGFVIIDENGIHAWDDSQEMELVGGKAAARRLRHRLGLAEIDLGLHR